MRNARPLRAPCCALVLLAACSAPSAAAPSSVDASCPVHKLRNFGRDTACRNDGSLEFCTPRGDPALEARIASIAPSIERAEWHGRAKCDDARETHWALPTRDPAFCPDGAMGEVTGAGWETICRLAALPEVQVIVPTIWLR